MRNIYVLKINQIYNKIYEICNAITYLLMAKVLF
jgi:hypothetical protein